MQESQYLLIVIAVLVVITVSYGALVILQPSYQEPPFIPETDDPACDVDQDGYASLTCGGTDCDDSNSDLNPGETELCDGVDNDCDGKIDDLTCSCQVGETRPCGSNIGLCQQGVRTCDQSGNWGPCVGSVESQQEICGNDIDEDCDTEDLACPSTGGGGGGGGGSGGNGGGGNGYVPSCGNSILDSGEACDDGNTVSDDGCSSTCTLELAIETTALPEGVLNVTYNTTLEATGGTPPYTWTYTGNLPANTSLNTSTGTITGTPNQTGNFTFTIIVDDTAQDTDSRDFTVTINDDSVPTITTATLQDGYQGDPYSETITATGGNPPYNWSYTGTLPAGLTLNASTGELSGTPTQGTPAGNTSTFTVQVEDTTQQTDTQELNLTIIDLTCGNNVTDQGEDCDPPGSITSCTTGDGYNGTRVCTNYCLHDTCIATEWCGDDTTNGNEVCDGSDDTACPGECQGNCTCGSGPQCGNTVCEAGEDYLTCPADCDITNGLMAHWKFDNGSGSTATDSAGSNHGAITGATWLSGASCILGSCLQFDGVGDYVNFGGSDFSIDGTNEATISLWVRTNDAGTDDRVLLGRGPYVVPFNIRQESGTRIRSWIRTDGSNHDYIPGTIPVGEWYHVGIVVHISDTGNDYSYYIDGNLAISNVFANAGSLSISSGTTFAGSNQGIDEFFNGVLDDIRIYNRALTATEIAQLAGNGSSDVCPDGTCGPTEDASTCPADCPAICGDTSVTHNEVCDGSNLNGDTCVSQGGTGGSLACSLDCLTFDMSGCTTCGDGTCNGNENPISCLVDCPTTCGDSYCAGSEDVSTCPEDCTLATGCDCGSTNSNNPCTGTNVTQSVFGSDFIWEFNCAGGACQCGQFVTGDYWVVPITASGTPVTSVTLTAVSPAGEENGMEVNPRGHIDQGILSDFNSYNSSRNTMNSLPYQAQSGDSLIKMDIWEDSGSCGGPSSCAAAYSVLTILGSVPQDVISTVFRPSFYQGPKTLFTVDNVRFERLPSIQQISDDSSQTSFSAIAAKWSAAHYEISQSLDLEIYQATTPHNFLPPYAGDQAQEFNQDMQSLFGTEPISEKRPAVYSLIQRGIDIWGAYKDNDVRFGSGAGQRLGKKQAIVFLAAMYDDTTILDEVRTIASDPAKLSAAYFQEDTQIFPSRDGSVILWGDGYNGMTGNTQGVYCTGEHALTGDPDWYWEYLLEAHFTGRDSKATFCDAHGYIDGPSGGPNSSRGYKHITDGVLRGYAFSQHLMPWLEYASNDSEVIVYSDRSYDGRGIPNFDGGSWTAPDPCAYIDPRESPDCSPHKAGDDNCLYFKVTWGPDPNNPPDCIHHNGDDYVDGRYSSLHEHDIPPTRLNALTINLWDTLRDCADPTHASYPCPGLGSEPT